MKQISELPNPYIITVHDCIDLLESIPLIVDRGVASNDIQITYALSIFCDESYTKNNSLTSAFIFDCIYLNLHLIQTILHINT